MSQAACRLQKEFGLKRGEYQQNIRCRHGRSFAWTQEKASAFVERMAVRQLSDKGRSVELVGI
jgi:hypothetical protein